MAIRVTHPSGATVEFPDGTDNDSIAEAMGQLDGAAQGSQQAPQDVGRFAQPALAAAEQRPTYSTAGEALTGAGKALGTGLLKGAIGLGTLPGNVEALVRAGVNSGAGMVGLEPPMNPDTLAINYNDLAGRVQQRFGDFYEPQTTAEKYIQTAGEFAPMVVPFGVGGVGARAAQVAAPAVASETAGQLTEGTSLEPWARVGGALAGGSLANAAQRVVTPAKAVDPVKAAHVAELQKQGVTTLTAGQKTGNARIRSLEDASLTMPGGGRATDMQTKSLEEFTSAALNNAGIQGATRATPDVIEKGFADLGARYNQVANVANVRADPRFANRIQLVVRQYQRETPAGQQITGIIEDAQEIVNRASRPQGMAGDEYLGFRSNLRRMERGLVGNPQAKEAVGKLVEQLDAQMIRTAPKNIRADVAKYMRDLNTKYRNLLAVEGAANKAGEKSAIGLISPPQLNAELKKQSKRLVARNNREIGKLATAGDDILRDLKSSGTAERNQAIAMLKSPAAAASSAMAGGLASGGDLMAMGASALAPYLLQVATARGITNPTMQRYLSNSVMRGPGVPAIERPSINALAPFLLQQD